MISKKVLFMGLGILIVLGACERNPVDRLVDPNLDGSLNQSSGVFIIYEEEFKTGGGMGFIPGGENQSVDVLDRTSPRRSKAQIRYHWNGGDVFNSEINAFQHAFAGFSLSITPDLSTLPSARAKDLSNPGYTQLKFFARGTLSSGTKLRIEGPDDGPGGITAARVELDSSQFGTDWVEYTLAIPAAHFLSVKTFATFSFQFEQPPRTSNPGEGGGLFLDDIRYLR